MSSVHSGLAVLDQKLLVRAGNVHATEMWAPARRRWWENRSWAWPSDCR
jgi:hypothetical protein